jgi:hypothetical protein
MEIIINTIITKKFNNIAVLFSGGGFEKIPPIYNIVKNPNIAIHNVINVIKGINQILFDILKLRKNDSLDFFLNNTSSFMRNVNNKIMGVVIKI